MKDRSVNSYNLEQAQEILSSLAPAATSTAQEKAASDAAAPYLRLSKDFLPLKETPVRDRSDVAKDIPGDDADLKPQKFSSWESCIAWCMGLTKAEAVFVVDSQGFVIASRGRVPGHGFEGTGAELVCSVEQLERVEPEAGRLLWVDLDFDKRRVVGFVTPSESSEYYVIGMIAPEPSYYTFKQILSRQIIDNLPNLD